MGGFFVFIFVFKEDTLIELCKMFQNRKSSEGPLLRSYNNTLNVAELTWTKAMDMEKKKQDFTILEFTGFGERL